MIFAGIDEAGLGPVLGPLVVSTTAFEADLDGDVDFWQLLSSAVLRKKPRKQGSSITIGDSKKLFNRKHSDGLVPLEQGVLAMLSRLTNFAGDLPDNFADLLKKISPSALDQAGEYPWYSPADVKIPRQCDPISVKLSGNAAGAALKQAGIYFVAARCEPMFAGHFNRNVAATDNKSTTTFDATCRGLMWLWQSFADRDMRIVVDRQGGRVHYREPLQRVFPDCSLKVAAESDKLSEYILDDGRRKVDILFAVGGEEVSLPTALASMISKYVREVFMEQLNEFWQGRVDGLESTAGYYVDGNRFFTQIADTAAELGFDKDMIYRSR